MKAKRLDQERKNIGGTAGLTWRHLCWERPTKRGAEPITQSELDHGGKEKTWAMKAKHKTNTGS